jgi:undecaprenyl-diphosphatase
VSDLLKAVILGIVQGLTEFLPVSSTGHLVIFQALLGVDDETFGLTFDASIHLGTLLAVLVYFRRLVLDIVRAWFLSLVARRWDATPNSRLAWLLVLGTIPAGLAGLALEDFLEDTFRSPALVAVMLILFSGVLLLAESVGKRTRDIDSARPLDAIFVGAAQAIALIPGVSRSGMTISAGMIAGFRREQAASFAFLLSAPIIAAAGGIQFLDVLRGEAAGEAGQQIPIFLIGMASAAVVGFAAIAFLLRFLRGNPLHLFIVYRVVVGLLVLVLVAAGVL